MTRNRIGRNREFKEEWRISTFGWRQKKSEGMGSNKVGGKREREYQEE